MAATEKTLETALVHHRQGRLAEAESLYRQVLAEEPLNPDALHLLGVVAHQTGHCRQAVELIGQAIGQCGIVAAYHFNLGEALRALGQYPEVAAAYRQALSLDENFAEAHNNLGTLLQNEGRIAEALACFDRAIACQPDYNKPHYNRARAWLSQGNFAQGWPEYEWRWKWSEFRRPHLTEPEWDGSPLAGRRLLVRAEQGLGDTLQFVRYLPLVAESKGPTELFFDVQPELIELLSQSGIGPLLPQGSALPAFDVHASLLSLPGLLGTTLETIPAQIPYLSAGTDRVEVWRKKLAANHEMSSKGIKIGIAWQGNPRSPLEPWRSIPLAAFAPLANVPGVQLVSLQKGFGIEQIAAVSDQFKVLTLSGELDQHGGAFLDTAALVTLLELVITSDSAIAHLAGALGRPVWVVLPNAADWRWLCDRSDSPWYPTMRLFRQTRLGDWSSLMEQVAGELARHSVNRPSRPH